MTYETYKRTLPMSKEYEALGRRLEAGTAFFPNRLAIQAMEGADGLTDGTPGELTCRRYDRFAGSGAGLLWFEATSVTEGGRANPRQLWLHEKNADSYKRLIEGMRGISFKENGIEPVIIMQATHSGRYCKPSGKPEPRIACNNPVYEKDGPLPAAAVVTDDELAEIEEAYAATTKLAVKCGFDGMDVKACHRYLNSELLSARTRPGKYGGSLENRSRFFINCVENARAASPRGFVVTARMNVYDGIPYPYGFGVAKSDETESNGKRFMQPFAPEDVVPDMSEPAELIKKMNFPFINITMGNPYFNPQVNRPTDVGAVERMYALTKQIKQATGQVIISSAPTFLRENSIYLAAGAVEEEYADIVGFGRMAFAYPNFAKDMLRGEFDKKQTCVTCGKCTELMRSSYAGCAVRDPVYTKLYKELAAKK